MVKGMCIGLAVGLVAGMALCGIPQVQRAVNDLKHVVERDVVCPLKDFIQDKKRDVKNAAQAVANEMSDD